MRCSRCGRVNEAGARHCVYCGSPLNPESEELAGEHKYIDNEIRELREAVSKIILRLDALEWVPAFKDEVSQLKDMVSHINSRLTSLEQRRTKPTSARKAICWEAYIKADWLEQVVWNAVSEAIKNPEVIIAALKEQIEGQREDLDKDTELDTEMKKLSRKIKAYDSEQKRLVKLFRLGVINENAILDELNQVKVDRKADQERLAELEKSRKTLADLQQAEIKLNEFCEAIQQQIDCSSYETKRLALDALDVKVYATRDNVNIQGIIPVDSVTIAQTSA
jgi:hypothetical protein